MSKESEDEQKKRREVKVGVKVREDLLW